MATEQSYKYQWARYVARRKLDHDVEVAKALVAEATDSSKVPNVNVPLSREETTSGLVNKTASYTGRGFIPDEHGKLNIGIVGAGAAGLFTAMVFDWLNEQLKDEGLKITYDILEAADRKRVGGRLYTHKFSDVEHDYYDVGAMRFPNNDIMTRTFQLFEYIGLKPEKGGLIPYYMPPEDDKVCPAYFNDIKVVGNVWAKKDVCDPFEINSGLPDGGKIEEKLLKENPASIVSRALSEFTKCTKKKFEDYRAEVEEVKKNPKMDTPCAKALWKHLMEYDHMSVRQFLAANRDGDDKSKGAGLNYNTIEWLETVTFGTGWYDQALTECVLEELDFATPEDTEHNYWYCVDGGAQKIAQKMEEKIKGKVEINSQVMSIDAHVNDRLIPENFAPMTLEIKKTDPKTKKSETSKRDYFAVFNSTTLPALQRMNLKDAGLLWGTKQAIRALGYGASCKVAIKFKSPWWQLPPFNINKGGLSRTDLPLRVCVYPSYNIKEAEDNWSPEKSAVLLCSYTWGQDAQRLGSLISPNTPHNEEELKRVLLHDLALMHAIKKEDNGGDDKWDYDHLLEFLNNDYDTHHAWDWYRDQNMSGAFAYFGPGQFSNMWEQITKPNAFGQLYLVGEAASSHHAWVVGALESVIRAVFLMFEGLALTAPPEFTAYESAKNLLLNGPPRKQDVVKKEPWELPTGLPFFPLPSEMPERQLGTRRNVETTDDPESVKLGKLELSYPAAVATVSLVESYFELLFNPSVAGATRA